jgi:hypothetical protein
MSGIVTHVGPWITFHEGRGFGWVADGVFYLLEILGWLIALMAAVSAVAWLLTVIFQGLSTIAMVVILVGALLGRILLPEPYRSRCGNVLRNGASAAKRKASQPPLQRRRRRFLFIF